MKKDDIEKSIQEYISEYEKEQDEWYERLYEQYKELEIYGTIKGYLRYWDKAYDVKNKTSEKNRNDIYSAIKMFETHHRYYFAYYVSGCKTLL